MPDFTLFISWEIVSDILSHLNQVDCTECMAVCRRWYKLIPEYGKNVWTELEISGKSWSRFNNAMLECLGSHVKKVSVSSYNNSSKILRRLERQECNIESLVFSARLFGTLKELFIHGLCTHYFPLTMLNILPTLNHFTFKLNGYPNCTPSEDDRFISHEIRQNIQSINDDNNDSNYNLVFLCLDSDFRDGHPIEKIVKRCSQLKYLLVSNSVITEYRKLSANSFSRVIELCPSICYIYWGENNISSKIETEWLTLSRRKNIDNSDTTSDYEKREANNLRQVEFCGTDEQYHISALQACLQQPSSLEHLRLSGHSRIDLWKLWNRFTQRNNKLLSQPSPLKSLELYGFSIPLQTENDISFQGLFSYFQHIERLVMNFIVTPFGNLEEKRDYSRKIVEALGHQLHQLQYLHLSLDTSANIEAGMTLFDTLSMTICHWNKNLEILHLYDVYISSEGLLNLCDHPKLHTLNLSGLRLHNRLTKDDWILFARKCKEQNQNNNGRIRSILLSCGYCDDVTDEVLEEFAGIKTLEILRIVCNKEITDSGVNKYGSIKSDININHKKIELSRCSNISLDNPYAVFLHSPFLNTYALLP